MLTRLQGISKDFMDEKTAHKAICALASKCRHEMTCPQNRCFFTDREYVESDLEDSDEENDDQIDNENPARLCKTTPNKSCSKCNFETKNENGLKLHMTRAHKIKCEQCGFSTTTKLLLKKHMKEFHVFSC